MTQNYFNGPHYSNTRCKRHKVNKIRSDITMLVYFRNQIRSADIEKVTCCKRYQKIHIHFE